MIRLKDFFEGWEANVRSYQDIDKSIEILKSSSGELGEKERQSILSVEAKFAMSEDLNADLEKVTEQKAEGIERIWDRQVKMYEFFVEYFLESEGGEVFRKIFGSSAHDEEQIAEVLRGFDYSQSDSQLLRDVSWNSRVFTEARIVDALEASDFQHFNLKPPYLIRVVVNPMVLREKVVGYQRLIEYLDQYSFAADEITKVIIDLYVARCEHLLAELYGEAVEVVRMNEVDGRWAAVIDEMESVFPLKGLAENGLLGNIERIDSFIYGRDRGSVVGGEVESVLESAGEKTNHGEFCDKIEELQEVKVDSGTWKMLADCVLSKYKILSTESTDMLGSTRARRAKDEKWQVVIDEVASPKVNSKLGAIRIPHNMNRSIVGESHPGAIPVLDHEIAHVVQHENRKKIPLRLCQNIGFDRRNVLAESGAVYWERECLNKFFCKAREVYPHYLEAVKCREKGGSYMDCVEAFYNSVMVEGGVSPRNACNLAVNRVMRIFRNGGDLRDVSGRVFSSKVLSYTEQEIVSRKLIDAGLPKILFVGGANLNALAKLYQIGLFDLSDVWIPTMRPSEIVKDWIEKQIS